MDICIENDSYTGERLEEGGGKGDCSQKKGVKVGRHHLACDLPLHHNGHSYSTLFMFKGCFAQNPVNVLKDWHVQSLAHYHLVIVEKIW